MQIQKVQWRKAIIAGSIGLVSSAVLLSVFWYGIYLSLSNCSFISGNCTQSALINIVLFVLLPATLFLGCAAIGWSLTFGVLRTAGIGLLVHILIPLLAQFLALPYSIGDEYVHLPLISSLALTLLASSWASSSGTVVSRSATIGSTIVLALAFTFTPFLPFGFLITWTLMPATYALFTAPNTIDPRKTDYIRRNNFSQ